MASLAVFIDGLQLDINMDHLKLIPTPVETSSRTLDATLVTDFVSNFRSWQIHWPELAKTTYDALYAKYLAQYTGEHYVVLSIPFYGINTTAKLSMGEKNIMRAGDVIRDVTINLAEQYAFS